MPKRSHVDTNISNTSVKKARLFSCDQCEYTSEYKSHITRHLAFKHDVGVEWFVCPEVGCAYRAKTKDAVLKHQWTIHNVNVSGKFKVHACSFSGCVFFSKSRSHLLRHMWRIHNVNEDGKFKWFQCPVETCDHRTKTKYEITSHLWERHNINQNKKGQTFLCSECTHSAKTKRNIVIHKWHVHGIDENGCCSMFACPQKDCEYEGKTKKALHDHLWNCHNISNGNRHTWKCKQHECDFVAKTEHQLGNHEWQVHNINRNGKFNWHTCPKDGCPYKAKFPHDVFKHLWAIHDIKCKTSKWHFCGQPECGFKTKKKCHLISHLWTIHDVNIDGKRKWYTCPHPGCSFQSKTNISRHLAHRHDIGNKMCPFCCDQVGTLVLFVDKNHMKSLVCRKCFKKATGRNSRAEEVMVHSIKNNPKLAPFLVLSDQILKGNLCQTRRRPDVYLNAPNLHVFIECDEFQHLKSNYTLECEKNRLHELCDEVPDGHKLFVRWNPDSFHYNPDYHLLGKPKNRQRRLELALRYIEDIINNFDFTKPTFPEVHYLFYDIDNPLVIPPTSEEFVSIFV